jgi:transposase-like protein
MSDSVELATAYLNPSPQLRGHANHLRDLLTRPVADPDPALAPQNTGKAWALNRRLSEEARSAIVAAHKEGVRQQALAESYEVSLSSIKRLIRASRLLARPSHRRGDATVQERQPSTTATAQTRKIALSSLDRPEGPTKKLGARQVSSFHR